MQYSQATFSLSPSAGDFVSDVLVAMLAELDFETFENPATDTLVAYVQTEKLDENALRRLIEDFPYSGVTLQELALCDNIDWNAEWEKHYFEPIIIQGKDSAQPACVIHSSFHKDIPACRYDIIIDPKMAFGTGHHQTTSLILNELLSMELQNKSLLDMGCGTAVLAILASMRGASPVTAIDIDNWCTENALENIRLNHIGNISVLLGDAKLLTDKHFDIILANINRNILLMDMPRYAACLPQGGELLMSGFYEEDVPVLQAKADSLGLSLNTVHTKDNWAMMHLIKN